ncbi:MAG TPA: dihydroorotate dehydrogenase [Acidimicrobiia bacterium]|nr:dihydroorotate dehydrogenase [Acidimicrobiia bacterium]
MRRRRRALAEVDLSTDLGGLTLANPIVAASGTFGHGDEVAASCDPRGLGAVTVKSLAPYPWPGNDGLRVTEAPGGGMLNAIGLPGPGVDAWIEHDLPALEARGARIIVSVWGRTVEEFARAVAPLRAHADRLLAIEVNVSCPNLEDRAHMFSHSLDATNAATRAVVAELAGALPVFVKLSPNVTDIREIAGAALDGGATGLTLINTVMGLVVDADTRRPKLDAGGGGLSGPPIAPVALRAVHDVTRAYPATPVIGTGGVSTGAGAVAMLLAGASAVGVGTATFVEPRATLRVARELGRWCAEHGVARVRDLVGALEGP